MFFKFNKIVFVFALSLGFFNLNGSARSKSEAELDAEIRNTINIPINTPTQEYILLTVKKGYKYIAPDDIKEALFRETSVRPAAQKLTIGERSIDYHSEYIPNLLSKEVNFQLRPEAAGAQDKIAYCKFVLDCRTKALECEDWHQNDEKIVLHLKQRVDEAQAQYDRTVKDPHGLATD